MRIICTVGDVTSYCIDPFLKQNQTMHNFSHRSTRSSEERRKKNCMKLFRASHDLCSANFQLTTCLALFLECHLLILQLKKILRRSLYIITQLHSWWTSYSMAHYTNVHTRLWVQLHLNWIKHDTVFTSFAYWNIMSPDNSTAWLCIAKCNKQCKTYAT